MKLQANSIGMDPARFVEAMKRFGAEQAPPKLEDEAALLALRKATETRYRHLIEAGKVRLCTFGLCAGVAVARGLCQRHYSRQYKATRRALARQERARKEAA